MSNHYKKAYFEKGVAKLSQLPSEDGYEVAFAGRSNAGKSSAINELTSNSQLARTSKTPGRTQLINYFKLDDKRRLVDLPGYGYAKVSKQTKEQWGRLLDAYLQTRQSLQGLVLLMDIRHPLKEFDQQLIAWSYAVELPIHLLLTKSDKLKRGAALQTLHTVQKFISRHYPEFPVSIQLFSALKHTGVETLIKVLDNWLKIEQNNSSHGGPT